MPQGYELQWGGEYSDFLRGAHGRCSSSCPLTLLLIFFIIFALYGNLKYPVLIAMSVFLTMPEGGLLALWAFHTNFSVSSGLGFLALFGISVQTGVIFISHANKLRLRRASRSSDATRESAARPAAADPDHRAGGVRGPAARGVLARASARTASGRSPRWSRSA